MKKLQTWIPTFNNIRDMLLREGFRDTYTVIERNGDFLIGAPCAGWPGEEQIFRLSARAANVNQMGLVS